MDEKAFGLEKAITLLLNTGAGFADKIDTPDGGRLVFRPKEWEGHRIEPVDPVLPKDIHGDLTFDEVASFNAYVNRFKDVGTMLFAPALKDGMPQVIASLDYHEPDTPRRCSHVATLTCATSPEWERWVKHPPSNMSQAKFAEWIEENREDIVSPQAAKVLEVVSELKLRRRVEFESAVNNSDGTIAFAYKEQNEEVSSGKVIEMPAELEIGVPVFFLGDLYQARVFLRYRIDPESKKLTFSVKVHRAEYLLWDAFDAVLNTIAGETDIAVLHGSPF